MVDVDSAIGSIANVATVGIVAGASMKMLSNVNRMANPPTYRPKRKRNKAKRKRR